MDALTVLAKGNLLVLDVAYAQAAPTHGQRAYVGRQVVRAWKLDDLPKDQPRHEQSNEFLEPGQQPIPHSAFPKNNAPVEVPNSSYYRKAVKKGALWAADVATAVQCGVKFDPEFGGEYPDLVKSRGQHRGKDG